MNEQNYLTGIQETLLMGPGPSCVAKHVYQAMSTFCIGHMDPRFIALMDLVKTDLQELLHTKNRLTIPVSGTGSAGMETCFVNLVEKGDPVLVLINGVFGNRMKEVAGRLGAEVDGLEFEWGKAVEPSEVAKQLTKKKYKIVSMVHAETSTGVCNPVAEIGTLVKEHGALYLVDTVTSFGGMDVRMDEWGIDALYSGTQKCLSCPPGLSPVSFSESALRKLLGRKTKVPNWYLDLTMITQYWEGAKRVYHHTAPINMIYGLYQSLRLILEEGLDLVFARHMENHQLLVQGLEKMGMEMLVSPRYRLPMLNAVRIPDGINDAAVRDILLREHRIEIGVGLGPLAGKIWRIGLMGNTARKENVDRFIQSLSGVLERKAVAA